MPFSRRSEKQTNHENVIGILDYWTEPQRNGELVYIVMERAMVRFSMSHPLHSDPIGVVISSPGSSPAKTLP
jgi:hypothetical protein